MSEDYMRRPSGLVTVALVVMTGCGQVESTPSPVDGNDDGIIDTAQAERMMLVVIDTSGSMGSPRVDTATRFEAAQRLAKDGIRNEAGTPGGLAGVAIYTFYASGIAVKTMGFIDPLAAINTIDTLVLNVGASPLAGSLCDVVDILATSSNATVTKMLAVYTDGSENNTSPTHSCYGPFSNGDLPPFDIGSWQNKVWIRAIESGVEISPALFTVNLTLNVNPGAAASAGLRRSSTSSVLSDPNFFSRLASSTGGQFRLIPDDTSLPTSL